MTGQDFIKSLSTRGITALGLVLILVLFSHPVLAQSFTLDLGGVGGGSGNPDSSTLRIVQLFALTTVLSIAPSILIMTTSYIRIAIVFGLLRQALGTMTSPPNMILVGLTLFLTFYIMAPVMEQSWTEGIQPYVEGELEESEAFDKSVAPLHAFMMRHVREQDLGLLMDLSRAEEVATAAEVPLTALIPAFIISELRRAFEIGFLVYLPFLVIDMVVASVLMSMGMMMLPPTMIALPFKLIFFVMVDGWYMIVGSLVQSFGVG